MALAALCRSSPVSPALFSTLRLSASCSLVPDKEEAVHFADRRLSMSAASVSFVIINAMSSKKPETFCMSHRPPYRSSSSPSSSICIIALILDLHHRPHPRSDRPGPGPAVNQLAHVVNKI
eukprot:767579-Hanusia_phi.AAC.16